MFTRDQILFSASKTHGMMVYSEMEPCNMRLIKTMVKEGWIEIRTQTVLLEGHNFFGCPIWGPYLAVLNNAHLTEAGLNAWARGIPL